MGYVITSHLFLPYCWVCKTPFSSSVKKEDHHLIPRAYGGVDGPQVSLCDSHHSALHEISLKMWSNKPFFNLLSKDPVQNEKLVYLASVVYNARLLVENDPNKKQMVVLHIGAKTKEKLAKLKAVTRARSREQLIELAIDSLYSKHFVK